MIMLCDDSNEPFLLQSCSAMEQKELLEELAESVSATAGWSDIVHVIGKENLLKPDVKESFDKMEVLFCVVLLNECHNLKVATSWVDHSFGDKKHVIVVTI